MEDSILAKITKLKLKIPEFVRPAANYESFKLSDNLVYISGQLPIRDGQLMYRGKVGQSVSKAQAIQASKQCAMNIVSQLNEVTKGHLDRVKK